MDILGTPSMGKVMELWHRWLMLGIRGRGVRRKQYVGTRYTAKANSVQNIRCLV